MRDFEDKPDRRAAAKMLARDEARAPRHIAKLPELKAKREIGISAESESELRGGPTVHILVTEQPLCPP